MNRIDETFGRLKAEGRTALIPYLTMGDPDIDTSLAIVRELELAGADIVELGVPYSDPLADGPVIQRASQRALKHRIHVVDCIRLAGQARQSGVALPFILFTYYNPLLQVGLERCFEMMKENDISGVIIPDLPIEEDGPVRELSRRFNIHLIPLVAPTSRERIAKIAADASGFIYCVSSMGVTGVRSSFHEGVEAFVGSVKSATELPVCVGFGISSREHVARFGRICDGAIVGSAIVRQVEDVLPGLEAGGEAREKALLQIREFVRQLRA